MRGWATKATSMQSIDKAMIQDPHDPTQIFSRGLQATDRQATYLLKEDGNILLAGVCLLGCLPVGVGDRSAVVVHVDMCVVMSNYELEK